MEGKPGYQLVTYMRGYLFAHNIQKCDADITMTDAAGNNVRVLFHGVPPDDAARVIVNGKPVITHRNGQPDIHHV